MFDSIKSPRGVVAALLLIFLAALPIYVVVAQQPFLLTLFSRIMIYAIAALSLNLLIGYVGLVSLGHAMFLMLGAYAVGLMQFHGYGNGWLQLLVAVAASVVVAFVTGWISLRTSGMAFIMITLAFAQMFFFLGISLKEYGGDDGMRLEARSLLAPFDLTNNMTLYYLIFGFMVLVLIACYFLINSRFGFVLRGIKSNERRIKALGFSADRYKMGAMIISAVICAVAGFLLANLTKYTSPSYGAWNISGELIVIVVLGGMGTLIGPLAGAIALLLFEEFLTSSSNVWVSTHWQLILGATIVLIVLFTKRGLYGSLSDSTGTGRNKTTGDSKPAPTTSGGH
jgi:branched-chain amino acid transport system permease protein